MKVSQKALSLLGLAANAGLVASGGESVQQALQKRKVKLLLCEAGISPRSVKDMQNSAQYYHLPLYLLETEHLGKSIGKDGRRMLAVTDEGFARRIRQELDLANNEGEATHE